jgi:hypothetical protein
MVTYKRKNIRTDRPREMAGHMDRQIDRNSDGQMD